MIRINMIKSAVSLWNKAKIITKIAAMNFSNLPSAKLISKTQINHDSYIFRFETGNDINKQLYKPGSHFAIMGLNNNNQSLKKKYTPIETYEGHKYFEALIKIYRPNEHPLFPQGGLLTPQLENLKIGETALIAGPLISIYYQGEGKFNIQRHKQKVDKDSTQVIQPNHILFIAGGTGIAPFYSMLQEIVREGTYSSKITLLFGNKSIADIVLKEQLDSFAQKNKNINIVYAVDKVEEGVKWTGEIGQINDKMIQKYAGDPKDTGNYVMICGNTGMNKSCLQIVDNLGFDPYHYFRF